MKRRFADTSNECIQTAFPGRSAIQSLSSRVEISLISYKDHIWFHTVHTRFLSTILLWNPRNVWSLYDYKEIIQIIYDLVRNQRKLYNRWPGVLWTPKTCKRVTNIVSTNECGRRHPGNYEATMPHTPQTYILPIYDVDERSLTVEEAENAE